MELLLELSVLVRRSKTHIAVSMLSEAGRCLGGVRGGNDGDDEGQAGAGEHSRNTTRVQGGLVDGVGNHGAQ